MMFSTLSAAACSETVCSNVFGPASKFNLYAFGNVTLRGADSAGTIGVGGYATISSFTANSNLNLGYSLLVQADLDIGGLLVSTGGSVIVGGKETGRINFHNGGVVSALLPLDFTLTTSYLISLSALWSGLSATGTIAFLYGSTTFTCNGDANIQVFNMPGSNFHSFGSYRFNFAGCSATQTIIINVAGLTVNVQNGQGTYGVVSPAKVVFNFYEATTITIQHTPLISAVLAPFASITGSSAPVCQIFAKSLVGDGSFEFHDKYEGVSCWFDGCLPVVKVGGAVTLSNLPPLLPLN